MSQSNFVLFTCPHCSKQFEITTWSMINTNDSPDLQERFKHNEIFTFECPHCHHRYWVEYPCCYLNPEKKFAVYLSKDALDKIVWGRDDYVLRWVDTIDEMIEKVDVFENEQDDRIIEFGKLLCEKQLTVQEFSKDVMKTLYFYHNDDGKLVYGCTVDGESKLMELDYQEVMHTVKEHFGWEKVVSKTFMRVNRKTVLDDCTSADYIIFSNEQLVEDKFKAV